MMINASFGETAQLVIGAIVGLGLSITMDQKGLSLSNPYTRGKAIAYLSIFCFAWVVGMTALTALFGE